MSEYARRCYSSNNTENEAEARAGAAAIAYNKNFNILVVPSYDTVAEQTVAGAQNLKREDFQDFLRRFMDEDGGANAEAKAIGKAKVVNANINLILNL